MLLDGMSTFAGHVCVYTNIYKSYVYNLIAALDVVKIYKYNHNYNQQFY